MARVLKVLLALLIAVLAVAAGAVVVVALAAVILVVLLVRSIRTRLRTRRAGPARRSAVRHNSPSGEVIDIVATEVPAPKE